MSFPQGVRLVAGIASRRGRQRSAPRLTIVILINDLCNGTHSRPTRRHNFRGHSILMADVFLIVEAQSLPLHDVEPQGIRCGLEQFVPRGRIGSSDGRPIPIKTLQIIQGNAQLRNRCDPARPPSRLAISCSMELESFCSVITTSQIIQRLCTTSSLSHIKNFCLQQQSWPARQWPLS